MKGIVECDKRGRVTLGKEITEQFGTRFHIVVTPRDVVLLPAAKDPIKDLRELARESGLDKLSPRRLKREARKLAEEEAMRCWRKPKHG